MKNELILLFFLLITTVSSCQNDKRINDKNLNNVFEKELLKFDNIKKDTAILVSQINNNELIDLKKHNAKFKITKLNWYNIEEKLFIPFQEEKISESTFENVIDTLNFKLSEIIPLHFQKKSYKQLKTNNSLFNKIISISEKHSKNDAFLVKVRQRPEKYKNEIIDSINDKTTYKSEFPNVSTLLAIISKIEPHEKTLKLLEVAVENLREDSYNWFSGDELNVFEYLIKKGDEATKEKTYDLLFKYLKKSDLPAFWYFRDIIRKNNSEKLKKLIKFKFNTVKNLPKDNKERKLFNEYYLNDYARLFKMESLKIILEIIQLDKSQIKVGVNQYDLKIKKYSDEVVFRNGLRALTTLSKQNLSKSEKKRIFRILDELKIQYISWYWRDVINIIKNLKPNSKFEDFKSKFENNIEIKSIEEYWNRKIYSWQNIEKYLAFFDSIGIDTSVITKSYIDDCKQRDDGVDNILVIWEIMEKLKILIHYDCETGVWPNEYEELITLYLKNCDDLKDYRPICTFENLNSKTKYTSVLLNNNIGFKVHPRDFGDWYDPNAIENLLNTCLKHEKSKERFIQLESGDQTVISVYAKPSQVKAISKKYDMKMSSN